jgi:hypothetical protein
MIITIVRINIIIMVIAIIIITILMMTMITTIINITLNLPLQAASTGAFSHHCANSFTAAEAVLRSSNSLHVSYMTTTTMMMIAH